MSELKWDGERLKLGFREVGWVDPVGNIAVNYITSLTTEHQTTDEAKAACEASVRASLYGDVVEAANAIVKLLEDEVCPMSFTPIPANPAIHEVRTSEMNRARCAIAGAITIARAAIAKVEGR